MSGPTWSTRSSGSSTSPWCCARASSTGCSTRCASSAPSCSRHRVSWPPAGRGTSPVTWPWPSTSASTSPTRTRWTATASCARCTLTCVPPWSTRLSRGAGAAHERWRAGAELACSLYGYWQISWLLGEGRYWLTKVLDRFTAAGPERARALVNRGLPAVVPGEHRGRARRLRGRHRDGARASATTPSRPAGTSTRCSPSPSSGGTTRRRRSATRRGPGCGRAATWRAS